MKKCTDCILDLTDACPRGSGRAVDDSICSCFLEDVDLKVKVTNGDMFKGTFPGAIVIGWKDGKVEVIFRDGGDIFFDKKWWNAPYKREVENDRR